MRVLLRDLDSLPERLLLGVFAVRRLQASLRLTESSEREFVTDCSACRSRVAAGECMMSNGHRFSDVSLELSGFCTIRLFGLLGTPAKRVLAAAKLQL